VTVVSGASLTYAEAARIVREADAVKDKSYRKYPLGQEWGSFLRAKRMEGCRPLTIDSYEGVGRRFTLHFADFESLAAFAAPAGHELVLDFLERFYGELDDDTLDQRWSVVASFFEWAYRTDRVAADPMRKLRRRRRRRDRAARRPRVAEAQIAILVSAQPKLRDQAALLLLARLGLRREDLRMLRLGDIDLARDEVHLRHSKGGLQHVLPIVFPDVKGTLYLHLQERDGHPDEHLVYPRSHRRRPLTRGGIGYWFERCRARAGLTGFTMHQLRHAAIDEVRRRTHDVELARQLGRHSSVKVTQDYLHSDLEELRAGLELMEAGES
jgi:integrase